MSPGDTLCKEAYEAIRDLTTNHRMFKSNTIGYIYLASPYSHKDKGMLEIRYLRVMVAVAQLFQQKIAVFSPIVHCHELAKEHDLPTDADFWKFYNRTMLQGARELWLLLLDGWKESKGMKGERDMAIELGLPYRQVEPNVETLRQLAQGIRELHKT